MNRHDRTALMLIALLLVLPSLLAFIFALVSTKRDFTSGPTILAPREGDEVGPDFSVDGTHGTSGVNVNVTVSGPFSGSGSCTSDPDWTVPFNAGDARGGHSANATSYTSLGGVNFVIVGDQALDLDLPTVSVDLTGIISVTVTGRHNQPLAPPVIGVALYRPDNTIFAGTTATDKGGGSWEAVFLGVPAGAYAAQAQMTVAGKKTTCSRFVRVN